LVFAIPAVPNEPPVANDDAYGVDADDVLTVSAPGVLDNDVDADGDPLTAVLATDVSHGALTLNADGSFSYAPDAGYVGDDGFTYVANDGIDDSTLAAAVTITVNDVPDIALTAAGRKVRGRLYADLEWTGAAAVNVYRDGVALPAGAGVTGGSYTDDIGKNGGGTFVYQVHEVIGGAETGNVSNEATVSF
jgi:VCBS repeat-containing protein